MGVALLCGYGLPEPLRRSECNVPRFFMYILVKNKLIITIILLLLCQIIVAQNNQEDSADNATTATTDSSFFTDEWFEKYKKEAIDYKNKSLSTESGGKTTDKDFGYVAGDLQQESLRHEKAKSNAMIIIAIVLALIIAVWYLVASPNREPKNETQKRVNEQFKANFYYDLLIDGRLQLLQGFLDDKLSFDENLSEDDDVNEFKAKFYDLDSLDNAIRGFAITSSFILAKTKQVFKLEGDFKTLLGQNNDKVVEIGKAIANICSSMAETGNFIKGGSKETKKKLLLLSITNGIQEVEKSVEDYFYKINKNRSEKKILKYFLYGEKKALSVEEELNQLVNSKSRYEEEEYMIEKYRLECTKEIYDSVYIPAGIDKLEQYFKQVGFIKEAK